MLDYKRKFKDREKAVTKREAQKQGAPHRLHNCYARAIDSGLKKRENKFYHTSKWLSNAGYVKDNRKCETMEEQTTKVWKDC